MTLLVHDGDLPLASWPTAGEAIVIDLEWTAWEGSLARGWSEPWEFREVIAIGAVRIEGARFGTLEELEVLVRPQKNAVLSDYIVALTGITDALLAEQGVDFAAGLARLAGFVGDRLVLANGADGSVLRENCILNGIPASFDVGRVRTIRPALARATDLPATGLVSAELPARLGISAMPARHGALADARAIVQSLAWLRSQGRL